MIGLTHSNLSYLDSYQRIGRRILSFSESQSEITQLLGHWCILLIDNKILSCESKEWFCLQIRNTGLLHWGQIESYLSQRASLRSPSYLATGAFSPQISLHWQQDTCMWQKRVNLRGKYGTLGWWCWGQIVSWASVCATDLPSFARPETFPTLHCIALQILSALPIRRDKKLAVSKIDRVETQRGSSNFESRTLVP